MDETSVRALSRSPSSAGSAPIHLVLLGGFDLRIDNRVVVLPASAERLLALLAVNERPASRSWVAGKLFALPSRQIGRVAAPVHGSDTLACSGHRV